MNFGNYSNPFHCPKGRSAAAKLTELCTELSCVNWCHSNHFPRIDSLMQFYIEFNASVEDKKKKLTKTRKGSPTTERHNLKKLTKVERLKFIQLILITRTFSFLNLSFVFFVQSSWQLSIVYKRNWVTEGHFSNCSHLISHSLFHLQCVFFSCPAPETWSMNMSTNVCIKSCSVGDILFRRV